MGMQKQKNRGNGEMAESKKKLNRAQKAMNILGWFHFAWFILSLVFIVLIALIGIGRFGAEIKNTSNPLLESLKGYDA